MQLTLEGCHHPPLHLVVEEDLTVVPSIASDDAVQVLLNVLNGAEG